jgi:ankyrin repeat protein
MKKYTVKPCALMALIVFLLFAISGCGVSSSGFGYRAATGHREGIKTTKFGDIIERGTPEEVQRMLDELPKGVDLNRQNAQGITPLMSAAYKNPHPESIKKLLAAGARLNALAPMDRDRSPVFFAAQYNPNPDITKVLLEAGAKLESEDADGATPLMAALHNPNPEVARFLIASGAHTRHRSTQGFTPLMVASRYAKPEFVKLLLEAGSDVNAATKGARITALMFAVAESRHPEIIDMLVQAGADVAAVDKDGYSALAIARKKKSANPEIEQTLIRAGAR